ncbi:U6 snRNA-associated Sm-like protein LSm7 [Grifola frondosa]|uniref:U6 snRNA-associated Sm-like protein LSm7 n=1 Tax=Grifola frondosa TaxID=5627 RepID=A0A1C7MHT2_GRIFR|nr:U6 snRNA-associated Sm-like protein LSm7 [Grifola frondosa]
MADRGRGASRGFRGTAGPARGGRHMPPQPTMDKPKREAILDLSKYANERIRVKFTGGREGMCQALQRITGILKGYDQLLNLVLDEVQEELQGDVEPKTRTLGLVVLRGPTITLLSPVDGSEEIANPFLAQE